MVFDSPGSASSRNFFRDKENLKSGGAGGVGGKNLFSGELERKSQALAAAGLAASSSSLNKRGAGSSARSREEIPSISSYDKVVKADWHGDGSISSGSHHRPTSRSSSSSSATSEHVLADRFVAQRSANGALSAPTTWGGAGDSLGSIANVASTSTSTSNSNTVNNDLSASFRGLNTSLDGHPSDESGSHHHNHHLIQHNADAIKDGKLLPGSNVNGGSGSANSSMQHLTMAEEQAQLTAAARNAAALGLDLSQQILTFAPQAPGSGSGGSGAAAAAMRARRPVGASSGASSSALHMPGRRKISNKPDKVLDAADICDDFYYNLIDWSVRNQVAIALRSSAYIWDCETAEVGELVDMLAQPERLGGGEASTITCLKWHPEGQYLVVATELGYAQLWDTANEEGARRLRTFKPSAQGGGTCSAIHAIDWADSFTLTLGYASGLVVDHDIRQADSVVRTLEAHSQSVCGLVWRDDGKLLATGGNDNLVRVWSRDSDEPVMSRSEHKAAVKAISWSPFNNNILATGGGSACRTVNIWNVETNARLMSWQTEAQISSLHWSWYHRELLTTHGSADGSPSGSINLWSYPSGKNLHRIDRAHEGRILGSVLSPDGQKLASVDTGANELRFWTPFEASEEQQKRHRQAKGKELWNPFAKDQANSRSHGQIR